MFLPLNEVMTSWGIPHDISNDSMIDGPRQYINTDALCVA